MHPSWPGVMKTGVVIVRQFEISSKVISPVVCVCVFSWCLAENAEKWEFVKRRTNAGAAFTGTHWACALLHSFCSWWNFQTRNALWASRTTPEIVDDGETPAFAKPVETPMNWRTLKLETQLLSSIFIFHSSTLKVDLQEKSEVIKEPICLEGRSQVLKVLSCNCEGWDQISSIHVSLEILGNASA